MPKETVNEFCKYCKIRQFYEYKYSLQQLTEIFKDLILRIDDLINEQTIDQSYLRNKRKLISLLLFMLTEEYKGMEIDPE